jgi:hypothetical protein
VTETNQTQQTPRPPVPRHLLPLITVAAITFVLPLLGALLGGLPISEYLRLPFTERGWDALPPNALFTWLLNALALSVIAVAVALARPTVGRGRSMPPPAAKPWPRFVWFGVFALLLAVMTADAGATSATVGLVTLAVSFFANAHTERRTGTSLLSQRPRYFLSLFAASLGAGWLFYWLNLYLGLWTYPGASETAPFIIGNSLNYAVLLPALLSLRQWLASFPSILSAVTRATPIAGESTPQEGWVLMALALFGLAGAAIWPDWIYPLSLTAPILLVVAVQQVRRRPTLLAGISNGDWSRLLLPVVAAVTLAALAQAINLASHQGWQLTASQLGGPAFLGLPLPAWLWIGLLGPFGVWLGDQLTQPYKQNPQRRPPRMDFPVRIEVEGR